MFSTEDGAFAASSGTRNPEKGRLSGRSDPSGEAMWCVCACVTEIYAGSYDQMRYSVLQEDPDRFGQTATDPPDLLRVKRPPKTARFGWLRGRC